MSGEEARQARSDALKQLGYDPEWIASGFLDPVFLEQQAAEYARGDDRNAEHYRYAAFLRWIAGRELYEEAEVGLFLFRVEADPDRGMALSAALVLLRDRGLTDGQFHLLSECIVRLSEGCLKKIVEREGWLRRLEQSEHLTREAFEAYMALADPVIQEYLLRHFAEENENFLRALAEDGAARRIRNMAGQKLKRFGRQRRSAGDDDSSERTIA